MTTRQRFRGGRYRLELRERDHGPAHVHLVGGDVDVLIELATLATRGRWPAGLKQEVMDWVQANRDELWEIWRKWHP